MKDWGSLAECCWYRSSVAVRRGVPGARGSKWCCVLGAGSMRQRVEVAAAGGACSGVSSRQGVDACSAAKLKRRAGVRPMAPVMLVN